MELIKKIRTDTGVKNVKFNPVFYLDKDISTDEIKLPNIRRYEMVTLPPFDVDIEVPKNNKKSTLKGYVFTATRNDHPVYLRRKKSNDSKFSSLL